MSFLNTTATLHHRTLLPSGTTLQNTLTVFENHDTLIRLDPELSSYIETPAPANAPNPKTRYYKITDNMHTLPRGLWDTTVSFDAEMTDLEDGIEWVIKAPLGLWQKSVWRVRPAGPEDVGEGEEEKKGRLVIVEDVEIKCSRLLVGTVQGKCEDNWRGVHGRFVEKVVATG